MPRLRQERENGMATQAQFEFFKYLYDEEQDRYKELVKRGQLFLTVTTLYAGVLAQRVSELLTSSADQLVSKTCYTASIVALLCSSLLGIVAIGFFSYEVPNRPCQIIMDLGDQPPTDEDFYDVRIAEFAVATERNHSTNDKRAAVLRFSSYFLYAGVVFHALYFGWVGFR
jgi:hypothetical protein